ncbi:MAG TPA: hypothetical protein VLI67_01495, partial [Vicinamibacteria bacterium]|nr:hypothetical protein [Vicinamibacteria bacterium]
MRHPRARLPSGPALRRPPLPLAGAAFSAALHAAAAGAVLLGAWLWPPTPTRTYIVNLVPA